MNHNLIKLAPNDITYCMEQSLAEIRYRGVRLINDSMTYDQWYQLGASITESYDRWEYIVHKDGKLYAEMCFHIVDDFHCGRCLNLLHCFTHPEHTGLLANGFKAMKNIAKQLHIPYLCITRDNGDGTYATSYRKVR